MSDRPSGLAPPRVVAVLGPTNTGKTHLAVERMAAHASGMIGLPLRLLAREVYERVVRLRGRRSVALITGEEKIVPPRATHFVCTVEAMPLSQRVEFLAVDEIQLAQDPERGHVFTHRLLNARGEAETMFLGSSAMAPLLRRLIPGVEITGRDRLSVLTYAGSKKITRLPKRTAVVAFSADQVYAIAELLRRQRGGAAVVMGALSPRTRNAQVDLYQSGEVDFLVATDAIGMGLNMDVDHVAFAALRKFDGRRVRYLTPQETAQIAGRAGRYMRDGTFGVTGDAAELDEDLIDAVEAHHFPPVERAVWRNARLDLASLRALRASLTAAPPHPALSLAPLAMDEAVLNILAEDPEVAEAARGPARVELLWDACRLPDFQKRAAADHASLVRQVFEARIGRSGRLPEDWIARRHDALDRTDGEIDQLSQRLAGVRTLSYIANRSRWVERPEHWRERTRALEDRLSDALHDKLTARFVDRRTSVLMRALQDDSLNADVSAEGQVTVEGHAVGELKGLAFTSERADSATVEGRTLRAAARRAVEPEVARRLGALAADEDSAFALTPDAQVLWRGAAVAVLTPAARPFAPRVRLLGELGPEAARERAARRIEAWLAAEAGRWLAVLRRLDEALTDGRLKGLARGVAWRVSEAWGLLPRAEVEAEITQLSKVERRTLRELSLRIGAHAVWLPPLSAKKARAMLGAYASARLPGWRPRPGRLAALPEGDAPQPEVLAASGLVPTGPFAVPVLQLERFAEARRGLKRGEPFPAALLAELGWSEEQARQIAGALRRARPGAKPSGKLATVRPDSPFAALASLNRPAKDPRTKRRRSGRSRTQTSKTR
ncbi:DEAD/DEAH box helicase [Brevundimonas sp. 2R-24]|uniref:DEAD/DEAH box helicase n=1 Tax=Peiella sedimenti TaxID=3061083 RepID=A0ABT8SQK0_9CAUL|nr:DEAD/DEAH box helicase [Caulobacteraceae bacterium XZ-24]